MVSIDYEIVHRIYKVQVRQEPKIEEIEEKGVEVHPEAKLISDDQQSSADQQHLRGDVRSMAGEHLGGESYQKDPTEMSDEELESEIQRLEALEKSSQPDVVNPYESLNRKPLTVNKIGRNDPCPCGAMDPNTKKPYKWKKCGLIDAPYHKG